MDKDIKSIRDEFISYNKKIYKLKLLNKLTQTMINNSQGFIWLKRFVEGKHVYSYANKSFLDKFFGLTDLTHENQIKKIKGKNDIELITEYKEKTGNTHSYGELCQDTDIFARDKGLEAIKKNEEIKAVRFIEMGIINDEPFILSVFKTPLFKTFCESCDNCLETNNYCGNIGHALDITKFFDFDFDIIKKSCVKLSQGVYWIKPNSKGIVDTLFAEGILKQKNAN